MVILQQNTGGVYLNPTSGSVSISNGIIEGGYYLPVIVDGVLMWIPSKDNMEIPEEFNIVDEVLKALPNWDGVRF